MRTPPGKRGTGRQPGRSIAPELPELEPLELPELEPPELPELPELELPELPELPELEPLELELPELPELMAGLTRAELLELAAELATHPACNIAEAVAELLEYTPITTDPAGDAGPEGKNDH